MHNKYILRDAASADDVREESALAMRRNTQPDVLAPLWLLLMGLAMSASWGWRRA